MKWYYWAGLGAAAYFLLRGKRRKVRRNPSRAWHEERRIALRDLITKSKSIRDHVCYRDRADENIFALSKSLSNPRRRRR